MTSKNKAQTNEATKQESGDVANDTYAGVPLGKRHYLPSTKVEDQRKFGKNLEDWRRSRELTIEQLAKVTRAIDPEESGISASSLSRYERGETMPAVRELKLLAFSLRCSIAALCYYGKPDPHETPPDFENLLQDMIFKVLASQNLVSDDSLDSRSAHDEHEKLLAAVRAEKSK
jgi:transcriptional regulator with XRE-family HTH domain